jgi:hypothetical protein
MTIRQHSSEVDQDLVRFYQQVLRGRKPKHANLSCHFWQGQTDQRGYLLFYVGGENLRAIRWLWGVIHRRTLPSWMDTHHLCGNRRCVELQHIQVLPHPFHMKMHAGGPGSPWAGTRNSMARLTPAMVRVIRSSKKTGRELARQFGVAETTISAARNGRTWIHVK